MAIGLKPCPFCGGYMVFWENPEIGEFCVFCAECKTRGPVMDLPNTASTEWNTRPTEDNLRFELDQVRAEVEVHKNAASALQDQVVDLSINNRLMQQALDKWMKIGERITKATAPEKEEL